MFEKDNKSRGYWSNFSENCVLFKSNVFMNGSGASVSKAYKKIGGTEWGRLCVIHDDLELPLGKTKLRTFGLGK